MGGKVSIGALGTGWRTLVLAGLLFSEVSGAESEPRKLTLQDGREFRAARIIDFSEQTVTLTHAEGVTIVPFDSVPLDELGRAYEQVQARRAATAKLRGEVTAKEEARGTVGSPVRSPLAGTLKPSRLLNKGKPALVPTGDSGPRDLIENGCVVATNAGGTGTAFVLRQKDGFVLVSNQHVINGGAPHRYERADGSLLKPLIGVLARDRDLVVFELEDSFSNYYEMEPDISSVALGEDLLIYGNSLGRGVRASKAKLVAKSPTQIEISGGIVSGNSGGPILRAKTGEVVGVSTFVTVRSSTPRTLEGIVAASVLPKVQYYGVRIDTLESVAGFSLPAFLGDLHALEADEARLKRAVSLLALMARRVEGRASSRFGEIARGADAELVRTVGLLKDSVFYPGTISVVDVNAFKANAGGLFAPIAETRSYIHARKREALLEHRAALLEIYSDLLKRLPVK